MHSIGKYSEYDLTCRWSSRRRILLASAAALTGVALLQAPVLAQVSTPSADQSNASANWSTATQDVVVTGTHIRGSIPASPIVQLDRTYIEESGLSNAGDLLRSLPQNYSGGQNPGVVGAPGQQFTPSGASSPNLRGLGADATLTLIDGHRLAYDGYQNNVDISILPLAAIMRIDVLTDGASALYGADAVAGVVNFNLRHDYDGVETTARIGGATEGGSFQQQYSALAGKTWEGGNVLLSYEHSSDSGLLTINRPNISDPVQGPTSLMPNAHKDSFFATANQVVGDGASMFGQALITSRNADSVTTFGTSNVTIPDHVAVIQYGLVGGVELKLPDGWTDTSSVDYSFDRDALHQRELFISSGALLATPSGVYSNSLFNLESVANGPIATLPTGIVKAALGGGYRQESFGDENNSQSPISARRDVEYLYGELEIPLVPVSNYRLGLERLDLSFSDRFEHYSAFGSTNNPKVGLVYVPFEELKLRATWGASFRAPSLLDEFGPQQLTLYPVTTFSSSVPTGQTVLLSGGGNRNLRPETSRSWTAGFDYSPHWLSGLKAAVTYYNIDYDNRILQPISGFTAVFNSAYSAPFIVYAPDAQLQNQYVGASQALQNLTGQPYNPSRVYALVEDQWENASSQHIEGVDASLNYRVPIRYGTVALAADASWSSLHQKLTATSADQVLDGTIFNPPSEKERVMGTWEVGGFSATAIVNHVGRFTDTTFVPYVPIRSWTTLDTTLLYRFGKSDVPWSGTTIQLAVQNLLDQTPPRIASASTSPAGIGFDTANASALGRVLSLAVTKDW